MTGRPVLYEVMAEPCTMEWMVPTLIAHTFVENSVKYAHLGGGSIPLEIEVTAACLETEDGTYLDLIVRDNGQGYRRKYWKKLTEILRWEHGVWESII